MALRLFGYEFRKAQPETPASFAPENRDDGSVQVTASDPQFGQYGVYLDIDGTARTEAELINKYREMANLPEIDSAIDDIVNEAIVVDDVKPIVELTLEDAPLPDNIKQIIQDEFKGVLKLLDFNNSAYDIFRRYYVDGRMYYHAIIDEKDFASGIKELRYIDPRKIRKIREVAKFKDPKNPTVTLTKTKAEYFIYNEKGFSSAGSKSITTNYTQDNGIKIAKDSIVHVTSGLLDATGKTVLSHLHKAIRPMNQLRAMEDATLIYRITRAPERRVFYVDVGRLPKAQAEKYMKSLMTNFKNKLVYDATTGEVRDDRRFMTMLEDFWIPRRGDGKATEIITLPPGQNLGELADVKYFQQKVNRALNVPISRLEPETLYTLGRGTEIARDEIKFSKFIDRVRTRFNHLFVSILEKQLLAKNIASPEDWREIKGLLKFKYNRDVLYAELKDNEIFAERMNRLDSAVNYAGRFFSNTWIRKNILRQTDEDIVTMDYEIAMEMQLPQFNPALTDPNLQVVNRGNAPEMPEGGAQELLGGQTQQEQMGQAPEPKKKSSSKKKKK